MTIVWDVDDVLNDLMRAWFTEAWRPSHPECALSYNDIVENPPDRVLGVAKEAYLESLDCFRVSQQASQMSPNSAILDWLGRHGARCRHLALTARPIQSVPHAAEWVFRHFGAYVRAFGVVPSRLQAGSPVYDRTKAEFLAWFSGAAVLVDDSPENITAAEAVGVTGILYPRPWNRGADTAAEVLGHLSSLVGSE